MHGVGVRGVGVRGVGVRGADALGVGVRGVGVRGRGRTRPPHGHGRRATATHHATGAGAPEETATGDADGRPARKASTAPAIGTPKTSIGTIMTPRNEANNAPITMPTVTAA